MLTQERSNSDLLISIGQALKAWPFIMSSYNTEIMKALKKNGWKLKRRGSGHDIYGNNIDKITVPRGTKMYSRNYKIIMKQIKGEHKVYSRSNHLTRY